MELLDIVFCKDCVRHNVTLQQAHWDKSKACPLIEWRGKAKEHEFDYQFCVCGKRRSDDE